MSTILKVLKKIEDESDKQDPSLAWPNTVQTGRRAQAVIRRRRHRRIAAVLGFSFVALLIAVGLFALYPFDSISPQQHKKKTPLSGMSPEKAVVPAIPVKKIVTSKVQSRPDHQPDGARLQFRKKAAPALPRRAEAGETASKPTQDKPHAIQPKTSIPLSAPSPEPVKAASAGPIPADRFNLPVRQDDRIQLQAIAWAPERDNSFTVINNRIFREGQSVDGITITRIDKEAVYFRENGQEWRQVFRIK